MIIGQYYDISLKKKKNNEQNMFEGFILYPVF